MPKVVLVCSTTTTTVLNTTISVPSKCILGPPLYSVVLKYLCTASIRLVHEYYSFVLSACYLPTTFKPSNTASRHKMTDLESRMMRGSLRTRTIPARPMVPSTRKRSTATLLWFHNKHGLLQCILSTSVISPLL